MADTITVTITGTSSGSLAGQHFSRQTVTFTANGTVSGCYSQNAYQREYLIPYTGGTVSIGSLGTFSLTGQETLDFFAGVYSPEQIRLGGTTGGLTFGASMPGVSYDYNFDQSLTWQGGPEGSFVDSGCQDGPPSQCQWFATTTGGDLRLTSLLPQVDGQIELTPDSAAVAPEPESWTMAATGLLGLVGFARRRLGSRSAR